MNDRKSISYYKEQAKERLLGNYGIVVGSFVLIFALFYCLYSIMINAATGVSGVALVNGIDLKGIDYLKSQMLQEGIGLIVGSFYTLLLVGFFYIIKKISDRERAVISDLFYAFRTHPDKVLIMFFILSVVRIIAFLPADIISYKYVDFDNFDNVNGQAFLAWIVALVIAGIVYLYVSISVTMCYFVYLYDSELTPIQCMLTSNRIMKGNKLRYLYLMLSFIGYWALGLLSCGIGILYMYPYMTMTRLNMYRDLAGIPEKTHDSMGMQTDYGNIFTA